MIDKVSVIVCMRGKPNPSMCGYDIRQLRHMWPAWEPHHHHHHHPPPSSPSPYSPHIYRGWAKVHRATTVWWYLHSSCWNGRKCLGVRVCCPNMHLVYEGGAGTLPSDTTILLTINIAMGITEMCNPSIDKFLYDIPQFWCRNNTALRGCQKWYWTNRKYQGNLCREDKNQSSEQQCMGRRY